jgi:uncharacterized membrane protein
MASPIRVAIALGATIFWSSSFPAIRIGLDSYDPAQLTLLRYIVASALLVPVALLRRPRLPRLADVPLIFVPGVLGISAYHLLVSYGQQTISADAAGVLSNTSPIFTALLAFLGERLRPIGWIGIIAAFMGAVMIAGGKDGSFHVDIGGILVLLAAGVWALYFVGQKTRLQRYGGSGLDDICHLVRNARAASPRACGSVDGAVEKSDGDDHRLVSWNPSHNRRLCDVGFTCFHRCRCPSQQAFSTLSQSGNAASLSSAKYRPFR